MESATKETILQRFLKLQIHEFPVQNPFPYYSRCEEAIKLHTTEYPHEGELKGVIFLLVGYGEFVDMYGQYSTAFSKAGYSVFAYDRKGFGKSEGKRGKVGDKLVEECLDFIYLVVRER